MKGIAKLQGFLKKLGTKPVDVPKSLIGQYRQSAVIDPPENIMHDKRPI